MASGMVTLKYKFQGEEFVFREFMNSDLGFMIGEFSMADAGFWILDAGRATSPRPSPPEAEREGDEDEEAGKESEEEDDASSAVCGVRSGEGGVTVEP